MGIIKDGWYVLYTRPRHEKTIAGYLQRMQLESFLPLTKTLKIWQGKKKYVSLPLFPSYVFVKLYTTRNYFESLHIPGVLYYVRTGNKIAQVNDTIIQKLKVINCNNSYESIEVSAERFSEGSIINIKAGPFKGFLCEVIRRKGKYQILVRIELLQRSIIVDMPFCCFGQPEQIAPPVSHKLHLNTIPVY